jgi:predicted RNA-binding protein with PIN domain
MYLVDGNNVMAQRVGWHRNKPQARRNLMDELANFAQAKKTTLTVVFDGAPEDHFADGARYRGITVYYARPGADADSRIKEIVEKSRERHKLRVVTSDRALAGYVRRCGAQVIRSGEFRHLLEDTNSKHQQPATSKENPPALGREELLREMRYFGFAPEDGE